MAGLLLAAVVAVAARLETGYPPGITPPPFAQIDPQRVVRKSAVGSQGLEQVLAAPERPD